VDFRKQKRSNKTHASTTDQDARLAKKAQGQEAKLSYQGNVLMENRHGLVVDAQVTVVTGTSEVDTALTLLDQLPPTARRRTVAGDKAYDQERFVEEARARKFTPHVAQNTSNRRSAIDGRTTRHVGYQESQRRRKLVEQTFGWKKTVGLLRKLRHRGSDRVGWIFTFTAAVYDMVRLRTLSKAGACP
jgi:IS5 family transposase